MTMSKTQIPIRATTLVAALSSQYQISNKNIFVKTIQRRYRPIVLYLIIFFEIPDNNNQPETMAQKIVIAKVVLKISNT